MRLIAFFFRVILGQIGRVSLALICILLLDCFFVCIPNDLFTHLMNLFIRLFVKKCRLLSQCPFALVTSFDLLSLHLSCFLFLSFLILHEVVFLSARQMARTHATALVWGDVVACEWLLSVVVHVWFLQHGSSLITFPQNRSIFPPLVLPHRFSDTTKCTP